MNSRQRISMWMLQASLIFPMVAAAGKVHAQPKPGSAAAGDTKARNERARARIHTLLPVVKELGLKPEVKLEGLQIEATGGAESPGQEFTTLDIMATPEPESALRQYESLLRIWQDTKVPFVRLEPLSLGAGTNGTLQVVANGYHRERTGGNTMYYAMGSAQALVQWAGVNVHLKLIKVSSSGDRDSSKFVYGDHPEIPKLAAAAKERVSAMARKLCDARP